MKHFVLDTNVLLHDPRAIFQFEDNDVVIPIYVIEEIDTFKKERSERGRNAREVARILDELRAQRPPVRRRPAAEGGGHAPRRLGGALGADDAAREPDRRPPAS